MCEESSIQIESPMYRLLNLKPTINQKMVKMSLKIELSPSKLQGVRKRNSHGYPEHREHFVVEVLPLIEIKNI